MKGLKASLLTAKPQIIEVDILCGVKVNIRRMTANELMNLELEVSELNQHGKLREASLRNVGMLLNCLVDDEGKPISKSLLPKPEELVNVHDNAILIEAINVVKQHSIGTLDEAKKN
ncbi:TPA: phage tail protein [Proteus mirabilis]|nr:MULTISPECIES: phage tail protein [Proteus]DAL34804.1 MAG TPA_asm: tail assembly chaperone protein [Caudoviricetes sp.]AUU37814.1 phage tail protein [Proteus mirabilis]EKV7294575.1 phage tail protein [Proteus mirabilis]EKX9513199.1 phage tail protein [Proteus mirabilis]MBG5958719.1 phage tail protein [Proteus mirabilis]